MAAVMQMLGASDPLKTAVLAEAALGERHRLSCTPCSRPQQSWPPHMPIILPGFHTVQ